MLWTANSPYVAWLAYMVAAYTLYFISLRWTDNGNHVPLTRGNFGKEESLLDVVRRFWSVPTAKVLVGMVVAMWGIRFAIGGWTWFDLAGAMIVVLGWPIVEWITHVFVLHSKPRKIFGFTYDSVFAQIHRSHHRHPYHPVHGIVPVVSLVVYALIVPGFLFLLFRWPRPATMSACVVTMVLRYEFWHTLFHSSYKPRSAWFRHLRDHHLWHHFQHENYWYGVTSATGDILLGTNPDPKAVGKSPTARTLNHWEPGWAMVNAEATPATATAKAAATAVPQSHVVLAAPATSSQHSAAAAS